MFKNKNAKSLLRLPEQHLNLLTKRERWKITLRLLLVAGEISAIFLVILFSYQRVLLFTANQLNFEISYWILENPDIYNRGINFLIMVYYLVMVIALSGQYVRYRDQIILNRIRHYISEMAEGQHHLRIPKSGVGNYQKLVNDVNTLMDNIQETFDQKKKAERDKDELLNNIGHDIRTPLTSIIGYLGLLIDQPDLSDSDQQNYLNIAYQKALNMQVLLNDMFEYTGSTKATASMNFMEIPIDHFLEQVAVEYQLEADKHQIEIKVENEEAELMTKVDPDKMARIMGNLISNVFKYGTNTTQIKLHSFKLDAEQYQQTTQVDLNQATSKRRYIKHWIIIEVSNNGNMLGEDQLEKIFERTYRTDESRTSQKPGSGLGLPIVRNLVRLHKGHVYAKIEGEELIFRIELPQLGNQSDG